MIATQKGIWMVSKGKNDRVYINCLDESKVMHQGSLCEGNGLGIYGHNNLDDLVEAIKTYRGIIDEY